MKLLDLSNVTSAVSAPFVKITGEHLNSALTTLSERNSQIIPSIWGTSKVVFLAGDEKGKGVIYYNGETFDYEGIPGVLDTDYFVIVNSYDAGDPVKYSDGNFYSQHKKRVIKTQVSSVGSTGIQFRSARFVEKLVTDADYLRNLISITTSTVAGNQFLINANNTTGEEGVSVKYKIVPVNSYVSKIPSSTTNLHWK